MTTLHRLYLLFALVLVFAPPVKSESIVYFSPGVGFAWNFDGYFIFHAKVSVGVYHNRIFSNITLGSASSPDKSIYPHYYAELQFGIHPPLRNNNLAQLFYGGGVGATFHDAGKATSTSLRFSAFAGWFVFLKANFLFMDTVRTDIGGEAVLPISLNKTKVGSLGG